MRRREPAHPLLVGDILRSRLEESRTDEGYRRVRFLTPTGAMTSRVLISGVLVEKEDIGSGENPLYKMRVADPSGGISFTIGRYQPHILKELDQLECPSFVMVIGRSTSFKSKAGEIVITLNPERLVQVTRKERDLWLLLAAREAMARLWKTTSNDTLDPSIDPCPAEKGEDSGANVSQETRAMLRNILTSIERPRFSRALEETRKRMEESGVSREKDPVEEYEDTVLSIISDMDSGGGARWDDMVDYMDRNRLSRDVIEEVVSNLLDKGMIYEPVLGYLKAL